MGEIITFAWFLAWNVLFSLYVGKITLKQIINTINKFCAAVSMEADQNWAVFLKVSKTSNTRSTQLYEIVLVSVLNRL